MLINEISAWANRIARFESDSHEIFGVLESSQSRRFTLDESYANLNGLTLRQDEIFRQALRCVESGLFRAAHVMAWAGMADYLQCLAASENFAQLNTVRPNWNIKSVEQLADTYTEHALIDALCAIKIFTKAEGKALFGMLSKRNECAHPGDYFPSFNETLGYISEVFSRLKKLTNKYPKFTI